MTASSLSGGPVANCSVDCGPFPAASEAGDRRKRISKVRFDFRPGSRFASGRGGRAWTAPSPTGSGPGRSTAARRFDRLEGFRLRSYQPDIRSNAALVRRALQDASRIERETSPGVFGSKTTFEEALDRLGPAFVYAKEGGTDIRQASLPADATFVFSDNQDLTQAEEQALTDRGVLVLGLGPLALHTDHAIAIVQNELDRRQL